MVTRSDSAHLNNSWELRDVGATTRNNVVSAFVSATGLPQSWTKDKVSTTSEYFEPTVLIKVEGNKLIANLPLMIPGKLYTIEYRGKLRGVVKDEAGVGHLYDIKR